MPNFFYWKIIFSLFLICFSSQIEGQNNFPLAAEGYDSHAELRWSQQVNAANYAIFRSTDGQNFTQIKTESDTFSIDFTGNTATPTTFIYQIKAKNAAGNPLFSSEKSSATIAEQSDSALLDLVQKYTFRYFWDFAHPSSAMARERNSSGDIVTTGGSGFGAMAIIVGVKRGFISRNQGRDRLLQMIGFLGFADRFHGVFPHWMDGNTGNVVPFSANDNGGDLVETAFLMEGLLAARQFFDQNDLYETALRQAITQLWEDVEWDFYRKNNSNLLYWHWSPTVGWAINQPVRGWNEAMMVYLLAAASPTHPVPASLWQSGWAGSNYTNNGIWYGQKLCVGPNRGGPLFFAHYSFLGFDPREKKDAFCNYFNQNVAHSKINQAYCAQNPKNFAGYSASSWGLTASDDPAGYLAHEPNNDNGTISPTAALSSMPYVPTESLAALKHFYRQKGATLWGKMGFFDAFNESQNWTASSYLAIDQGPIIGMIENYRSGLLWENFMKNPEIAPALTAIGFVPDLVKTTETEETEADFMKILPNFTENMVEVVFFQKEKIDARLDIFAASGALQKSLFWEKTQSQMQVDLFDLSSGVYFFRIKNKVERVVKI